MDLNITKCKHLRISRKDGTCPVYHLNSTSLERVSFYKYLGVFICSNLSWGIHIDYIVKNANRTLGYIKRNFSLAPLNLKLTLYKTLVRSKLEYAAAVWDPGQEFLIHAIEAIQNRAVRFIFGNYSRSASVTFMKHNLHLPLLSLRRKAARLCLFQKIYYHNPVLKSSLLLSPHYISSRIDHRQKVGVPHASTKAFFDSFVPRTSVEWNQLPGSLTSLVNPSQFRNSVFDHFLPGIGFFA